MTAKAIYRHCCIVLTLLITIVVSGKAQLVANFSGTPVSGCSPLVVNFSDLSTGNPTQWKWDLGNGTISFLQNPSTTYFTAGTYNVKLIIQNAAGTADSVTKSQYITVYGIPTVIFSGTPNMGCPPLNTQFTDQSLAGSGTIASWLWDFGDGNTGNIQNPAHIYSSVGNYNVTLQVTNSFGCSKTLTRPQYIKLTTGVHADFSNTQPTTCLPPATINFTNLSTGSGVLNYQWKFGDGGISTLVSPSHTYNATGSYTVTLIVTNASGCTDTLVRPNAVVINNLTASFTSADTVCVGNPITFNNTTSPTPSSVLWNFGDATTSTALSPSKTYSSAGNYLVKLVSHLGTCSDSVFKTIVVIAKPTVSFNAPVTSSCKPPFTTNFVNNSTGGVSYQWSFGDGGTSSLQNPSYTYNSYGTFSVKLVVTNSFGCTDSLTIPNYITIQKPIVSINNLPQSGCSPLSHLFSATVNSLDPVTSYSWDFGDGNTSSLPTPIHSYTAGTYNITLIITTAGGCSDTVTMPAGIRVGNKPNANFGATPRNACAKENIQFTDSSTGNIDKWDWDFGDGGKSTDQNPAHHYNDTGYFSVRLIVWSNGCPDTLILIDYIHINPPIAVFANNYVCGASKTVNFTDQSIGADEWHWDFGNGDTSILQNPTYTFPDTGLYIITLRVINHITGCDDITSLQLRIIDEHANFIATDTVLCRNNSTNFHATESSVGAIASYAWDFGDGTTGSGQSPSHVYVNSGYYTVSLIITDIYGCKDTLTRIDYIRVDGPVAAFIIPNAGSCLQSAVSFTDNSTGDGIHPITTWIWNYGDGMIDTLYATPFAHTYATTGTFIVTLQTIDSKGCSDITNTNTSIIISKPIADFNSPDTAACPSSAIHFNNISTGLSLQYFWDFGDGNTSTQASPTHFYTADGLYTIKLVIIDQYGCTDSITKPNFVSIISPTAQFSMSDSFSTCPPLIVNFTNTSINALSYNWDFGDGSSATGLNPTHIYNTPGLYTAKLFITGIGGLCTDMAEKQILVRGPIGNFNYGPLNGCSPLTVSLTAHTPDRLSFIWDYSDGNILSTPDSVVSHIYTIVGNYVPKMILVDSSGCQVPIFGIDTIHVRGVNASFGFNNLTFCDSGIVHFTDSSFSNDGIASYLWKFGDGDSSILQNPSHIYTTAGTYNPQLIVTTNSGCIDTALVQVPIRIVASPNADFTNSPNGCSPLNVTYNSFLTVADTSAISWTWNLGNGNTSTLQNPPIQTYTNPQVYNISLITTNSSGCKDTVYKTVEAYAIPTVNAGVDAQICKGAGTNLTANGAVTYLWSPSTGLSCTTCANPVATPNINSTYKVVGASIHGCINEDSVSIAVIQPFVMQNDPGDTLCVGGSTRLFATGANSYVWSPAAGLSSTTTSTPLARPSTTTNYMVVGSDAYGCFKDTGYAMIKVYPKPTVDAGNDITIKNGQSITITPTLSTDVNWYYWIPTSSIVATNGSKITVAPKQTTEYNIEVKNLGGCRATDKVSVFVICDGSNVFIPNTFSPNGDGSNDLFYPRGAGLFSIKSLRIFDRWGELIFEKGNFLPNDINAAWDGTYKGKKLTSDVYVYTAEIICENSTTLVLKGNVTLLQ